MPQVNRPRAHMLSHSLASRLTGGLTRHWPRHGNAVRTYTSVTVHTLGDLTLGRELTLALVQALPHTSLLELQRSSMKRLKRPVGRLTNRTDSDGEERTFSTGKMGYDFV